MSAQKDRDSAFRKVGPCLYRYKNGTYYARFKSGGKEIRCSLETADRKSAERNLARKKEEQSQIDRSQGKLTLHQLCNRYLATVQHQGAKTIERKALIVRRMQQDWPNGAQIQLSKVRPSDVEMWLSRYRFGAISRNQHLACAKAIFDLAVHDRVIPISPAARLHSTRAGKPIRRTPAFEEFKAIVESIRSQSSNAAAHESADFVEFLGLAGLGQAEACDLRRDDIDWKNETIITFRHKTKSGFAIPLYPQLRGLLRRRVDSTRRANEALFKIRSARKAIANACRRLNLPQYSHRSFRRMFITRAIERGVDVKVIAEWQGHKDGGKLILDTYSHVNRVHSQRMAQLMTDEELANVVVMKMEEAS